jgi:hypothetical protein
LRTGRHALVSHAWQALPSAVHEESKEAQVESRGQDRQSGDLEI